MSLQLDANDHDIDELVIELINAFSAAILDKDRQALDDIYYLACSKASEGCSCFEVDCRCKL